MATRCPEHADIKSDLTHGKIQMIEHDLSARTTIPFSALSEADGGLKLQSILNTFGFAVISEVIDEATLLHMEEGWKQDLQSIINLPRVRLPRKEAEALANNPVHEWPISRISADALGAGKNFAGNYGLPHGSFAWSARSHPHVQKVFEVVCKNLQPKFVLALTLYFSLLKRRREELSIPWSVFGLTPTKIKVCLRRGSLRYIKAFYTFGRQTAILHQLLCGPVVILSGGRRLWNKRT